MVSGFFHTIKGILISPKETLIQHKDGDLNDALRYYLKLLIIFGCINGIIVGQKHINFDITGSVNALSAMYFAIESFLAYLIAIGGSIIGASISFFWA